MLREYQKDLIKSLRKTISEGNLKVVAVMPTGAGKTFTFTDIVSKALDKGSKVLILTDRIELLKQAGGSLSVYGLDPIVMEAGSRPYLGGSLYTAMVETLHRRIRKKNYQYWIKKIDLIIIDECHMRAFDKLFQHFGDNTKVIGFTATPMRYGLKGQMGEYYHDLVVGVEIEYLIEQGFLAQPKYYGIEADLSGVKKKAGDFDQNQVAKRFSENKVYAGVIENLHTYSKGHKVLVFSSTIASSQELRTNLVNAGFKARHLDSNMNSTDREEILAWYKRTPDAVLCNVGILTKGFDEPSIQTIVLYRATQSLPLYMQMVGRGSRVIPGVKQEFNILDFGNNIARHGFWHEPYPWSIEVKEDREKKDGDAVLKQCKNCQAFMPVRAIKCQVCGFEDEREAKERVFAILQELHPREIRRQAQGMSLREKVELSKRKIIKPYWVLHNLTSFDDVKNFVQMMGWSPHWIEYNYERFHWKDDYIKAKNNGEFIIRTSWR